jgi:hypothetical protein
MAERLPPTKMEEKVGEVKVQIELENFVDRYRYLEKQIGEEEIRRYQMEALIDTGGSC